MGALQPRLQVHLGLVGLPGAAAAEVGPHEAMRTPGLHVAGRGFPGPIRGEHRALANHSSPCLALASPAGRDGADWGQRRRGGCGCWGHAADCCTLASETGGGSEQSRVWCWSWGLTQVRATP